MHTQICSAVTSAGKFLAAFAKKYLLPWNFVSESTPQTWKHLADRFREELPSLTVNMDEAQRGHEDELVKILTLMMYLGAVKHINNGNDKQDILSPMQDNKLFSKEVQLRIRCILQALLDQQALLTSDLLNQIIISRVSETTGNLVNPLIR